MMGSVIEILGIKQLQLLANLPETSQDVKEKYAGKPVKITATEMHGMYYSFLFETEGKPDSGLKLLHRQYGNKHCFFLIETLDYFFREFDWRKEECRARFESEIHDTHYIFSKEQLLDLIDWYISISYVYTKETITNFKFEEGFEVKYEQPARYIILDHYRYTAFYYPKEETDLWDWSAEEFLYLRKEVQEGDFDYFFFAYAS